MKTALITTTINVPHVLRLYRKYGPDVRFFVAIDKKTPEDAVNFCRYDLENTQVCFIEDQQKWKCSELIGWNCIQRRNIALLEALKWGADVIVSVDDDNLPLDPNYFYDCTSRLRCLFDGLCAGGNEWFDPGTLLIPPAPQRGFPVQRAGWGEFTSVTDVKIGVVAGTCIGDPDTSAYFRLANHPTVHRVSELLSAGLVVDPHTWTVWNSQNTAIIRELAPAWSMWCGVGRHDDILASLVVQRVMRDRGYHVHFGKPFVWQSRNQHDLTNDLGAELFGMRRIVEIADFLDALRYPAGTVIEDARSIFKALQKFPWLPPHTIAAALAFLDDCETVL